MTEQIDGVDIENTTEDVELEPTTTTEDETVESDDSIETLREQLVKKEKAFNDQKIRAEKAERLLKSQPKVELSQQPEAKDLTSKDTIALINARVHEDDIDDIVEYAKFKKVSVSEALKSGVIKSTLAEKQEQRNTANATNTGKTRSGNAKLSGESLLDKAMSTGDVPESDADMKALAEARLNSRRRK